MATTSRANAARIGSGSAGPPGHTHEATGTGGTGGVTDHGALTGLTDDDHPQYLKTTHTSAADPHTQYLKTSEVIAGTNVTVDTATSPGSVIINSAGAGGGGGVTDHGALTGLSDDDHPQYLKTSEVIAGSNVTVDASSSPGSVIISSTASGGSGLPTGGGTGQALVKTSTANYAVGWTTIAGTTTLQGQIELDAMAGATDDDKLTNAMNIAKAQDYPPPILLGPRNYSFSINRDMYDGFSLIGVQGMGNAEKGSRGTNRTRVTVGGSGIWLNANGGLDDPYENWDISIRQISFTGNSSKQFMGSAINGAGFSDDVVIWCMNLRDCAWSSFKSVLGSQSTKLLINLCLFDGWLSFNNSYTGAIHIGGSDNSLFLGMTNIDSATGYLAPTGSNPSGSIGQYHLWFDGMDKTTVGDIYLTAEGGWNGIRVTGPAYNGGSSTNGGPITINSGKLEGRNKTAACNGAVIRVEGGILILRDTWVGFGMINPSASGHSPQDAGVIHQTGGQLLVDGCTYGRATNAAETVPFVYSAGGKTRVSNILTGSQAGAWSGLPRVDSAGGSVTTDSTVTVI
jgi:hypothetical protein